MRKSIAFLALSTFALAACGQSGSDGTAGGKSADPGKTAAEMVFQFQPGQYRTAIKIDKIEIPGMPAAAAAQMKGMMGKPIELEYCMSPEKAATGAEAMKENMAKGKCRFEKFEAKGGTVDSVMVCDSDGMAIRTTSNGTYTPTGSVIKGSGDMAGPGGQKMHIEQTVTMERIGDCAK
jgi:hypothetical protein